MVDDNNDVEYQLGDDDETIYEPEEEHHHAGSSPEPEKGKPKKPSKKRVFLAIIAVIIVVFVGYRLLHSVSSKKEISKVSAIPSAVKTTKEAKLTAAVVPRMTPTAITKKTSPAVTKDIIQLQQQHVAAMKELKKQQSDAQASLQGVNQKISSIDEQINNLQNLTKNMASQVKEVQQAQKKQQQIHQAVVARRARARAARISRLRREKSYFVQAVIPGRAWLRGADGSAITITKGDKIPGYGQVVAIDPYSGTVTMSSGIKLRYGIND